MCQELFVGAALVVLELLEQAPRRLVLAASDKHLTKHGERVSVIKRP